MGVAPRSPLRARSPTSKKALIGGLVGGLVGGLLLVGVLLLVFWKKISHKERTYANETAEVKPFVVPVGTPTTASFTPNPFTSPPASAALTTSTGTGSFAQQQAAAMREAKGRHVYTQATPGAYPAPSTYQPSTYQPSIAEEHQADGPSSSAQPARSPLLPPAYE